jgi:hypothetical protein
MSTKTYTSPKLSLKGSTVDLTNTVGIGGGDPEGNFRAAPAGSLGFLL